MWIDYVWIDNVVLVWCTGRVRHSGRFRTPFPVVSRGPAEKGR